jgi:hypothetical protein
MYYFIVCILQIFYKKTKLENISTDYFQSVLIYSSVLIL